MRCASRPMSVGTCAKIHSVWTLGTPYQRPLDQYFFVLVCPLTIGPDGIFVQVSGSPRAYWCATREECDEAGVKLKRLMDESLVWMFGKPESVTPWNFSICGQQ